MGTVVDLEQWREKRPSSRAREFAQAVPDHPALRWVAGEQWWLAHRRDPDSSVAVCQVPGELVLATAGVLPCPVCYPPL
jgi:hypothetical protein